MLDITGSVSNWVMKCEPLTVSSIRLPHVADICLEVAILEFAATILSLTALSDVMSATYYSRRCLALHIGLQAEEEARTSSTGMATTTADMDI